MKYIKFLSLLLALAGFTMTACTSDNKPKDSEKVADKANETKTETNRSEEDAQLLVSAVSCDYFEVAAADVAATMATQASVKEFATMMKNMHPTMMEETKALAAKKGYTVPTMMANDYTDDIQDMQKWTKGKEFDTKYIKGRIDQHQKMLDDIEKRMAATVDNDVKAWTQKASSGMRMHLDKANKIKEQLDVTYK
ncbi:MAG: DUF4142 domain-containing protein [Saprospiraceae bacterium]|nr:DUF4142 domain-containing protein [Saprospiraceae bacterium]